MDEKRRGEEPRAPSAVTLAVAATLVGRVWRLVVTSRAIRKKKKKRSACSSVGSTRRCSILHPAARRDAAPSFRAILPPAARRSDGSPRAAAPSAHELARVCA